MIQENKQLYKKLYKIGLPIALENMLYSFMNFIDIFMVGVENVALGLGQSAVAGLGLANQVFFIFIVSLFGVNSGGGILAAQYFGNKNYKKLRKVLGMTLIIGLIWGILFTLSAIFIPEKMISLFTENTTVIASGGKYYRIMGLSFIFVAIGFAYNMQIRAIGEAKYSLYSSIIGIIINGVLNYTLIYGHFGFKAYGVEGAAYATLIARIISTIYIILIVYIKKFPLAGDFLDMFHIPKELVRTFIRISIPVFIHELLWVIGISIYSGIFGRYGSTPEVAEQAVAGIQIVRSISSLMFTFLIGLASATSVIIGNEIGANNEDGAYRQTREIIKLTFIMSLMIAILLYFLSPLILNIMNVRKSLYGIITTLLLVECVLIIGRALSMQFIVGVLRAGGDTMWTMWLDLLTIWLFVMPLTYYTALVLHWPLFIVYFISGSDEFIKLIPCIYRFKSRKWINNFTKA